MLLNDDPKITDLAIAVRVIVARNRQSSQNAEGKEAVIDAIDGATFVIPAVLDEVHPSIHPVGVDFGKRSENFRSCFLQADPRPLQLSSRKFFDDVKQDE